MGKLKLISWNVNGIRAGEKKGFLNWLAQSNADIVAVQEIKAFASATFRGIAQPAGLSHRFGQRRKGRLQRRRHCFRNCRSQRRSLGWAIRSSTAMAARSSTITASSCCSTFISRTAAADRNGWRTNWRFTKSFWMCSQLSQGRPLGCSDRRCQHRVRGDRSCAAKRECWHKRISAGGTRRAWRIFRRRADRHISLKASGQPALFVLGSAHRRARKKCRLAHRLLFCDAGVERQDRQRGYPRRRRGLGSLPDQFGAGTLP